MNWFSISGAAPSAFDLRSVLDSIQASAGFGAARADIQARLSGSSVGLDALRAANTRWLNETLSEKEQSRSAFGQYLNPQSATWTAVPRRALLNTLDEHLRTVSENGFANIVSVLGGEGAGKSWLVTDWWSRLPDRPILLISSGYFSREHWDIHDPVSTLAKLVSRQLGQKNHPDIDAWRRRFSRWANHGPSQTPRIILLLDGLNEVSGKPWADLIRGFQSVAPALGMMIIATSREGFWAGNVERKLGGDAPPLKVHVDIFSNEELEAALRLRGREPDEIPPKLRSFIRNPRIFRLAFSLLDRLAIEPSSLTTDRLLLEYWREREEERGDLVAHNIREFEKLLASHAKGALKLHRATFDRDEWRRHSGAAQRSGLGGRIDHDLTEVEEGRFLEIIPGGERYAFKEEILPFALGLLIVRNWKVRLTERRSQILPKSSKV